MMGFYIDFDNKAIGPVVLSASSLRIKNMCLAVKGCLQERAAKLMLVHWLNP
jgi:hypothetical protein